MKQALSILSKFPKLGRIIDRYVSRQVLTTAGFAVLVLSGVLVLGNIFKELLEQLVEHPELDASYVLKFIANVLPFSLIFTIPWGFLTAVLLVFGRLSADNELTSLRMAGLSMTRICAPVLLLAAIFSMIALWLNVSVAPKAQARVKGMVLGMALDNPLMLFNKDEVLDDFPGYVIYTGDKAFSEERGEEVLKNLQIIELNDFKRPVRFVVADTALVHNEDIEGEKFMVMDLFDARIETKNEGDVRDLSKINAVSAASTTISISLQKLVEKRQKIRPSTMTDGELRKMLRSEELSTLEKTQFRTELNKRYSFSMACITFGLIGIPLGVTAQRRETSIGFALSMIIACVYFLFIIFADTFRDDPKAMPFLLMWLPNLVFLSLGGFLFYRLSRK